MNTTTTILPALGLGLFASLAWGMSQDKTERSPAAQAVRAQAAPRAPDVEPGTSVAARSLERFLGQQEAGVASECLEPAATASQTEAVAVSAGDPVRLLQDVTVRPISHARVTAQERAREQEQMVRVGKVYAQLYAQERDRERADVIRAQARAQLLAQGAADLSLATRSQEDARTRRLEERIAALERRLEVRDARRNRPAAPFMSGGMYLEPEEVAEAEEIEAVEPSEELFFTEPVPAPEPPRAPRATLWREVPDAPRPPREPRLPRAMSRTLRPPQGGAFGISGARPEPNAVQSVDLGELRELLREMRDQVSDLRSDLRSLRNDLRQLSAGGR